MALTSAQRMLTRLYLGWSERFHQTDTRLEQAMNAIDSPQNTDALAQLQAYLTTLADIDARLTDALCRLRALEVGSIKLPGPMEIGMLRSQGRMYAGRIASILGVEIRHDVFSGGGPREFATAKGMMPARGGFPPLG